MHLNFSKKNRVTIGVQCVECFQPQKSCGGGNLVFQVTEFWICVLAMKGIHEKERYRNPFRSCPHHILLPLLSTPPSAASTPNPAHNADCRHHLIPWIPTRGGQMGRVNRANPKYTTIGPVQARFGPPPKLFVLVWHEHYDVLGSWPQTSLVWHK